MFKEELDIIELNAFSKDKTELPENGYCEESTRFGKR